MANKKVVIAYTTDVHGHFFPYDFINKRPASGSMARVATAVDSLRNLYGEDNVLLFDNGDILQGQPTVYYYNFIDTTSRHIVDEIYEYLKYDVATIGNHDVETGHSVYDRVRTAAPIEIMGANVIDNNTGLPYLIPYKIFEKDGLKIAVIGLLTPAIPAWLPERLWSGLHFDPMEESARYWVKYIKENEHPDIVIGLFHSGRDASKTTAGYVENASLEIARNVPGFDAVLMGHDHQVFCDTVVNVDGKKVVVLNPANNANNIGIVTISNDGKGNINVDGAIESIADIDPSEGYLSHFIQQYDVVNDYVTRQVSFMDKEIATRDAYFGPSEFMTLLHQLQLDISGADISMAAPLTFDGVIKAGPLMVSDMFTLYKYENMLCTLLLTGKEIKDYLEYSYSLWSPEYNTDDPHIIRYATDHPTPDDNRLKNPSYNFDSAAGIDYEVDLSKTVGERVRILRMSDGRRFDPEATYTVAVNSYRAGGGGNHLTDGAGINIDELKKRVVTSTDKDLRYYLTQRLSQFAHITPSIYQNWKFVPEQYVNVAKQADYNLLFSPESSKSQK
ncbi:MAG: 5'-nucleotidase C-terminal domain-containing protein [Bacteroides sp.]|nr:5'-nucleotidase C-terminal domain-containing protein [Bacteroides sp.]